MSDQVDQAEVPEGPRPPKVPVSTFLASMAEVFRSGGEFSRKRAEQLATACIDYATIALNLERLGDPAIFIDCQGDFTGRSWFAIRPEPAKAPRGKRKSPATNPA